MTEWRVVHAELSRLSQERAAADAEEGRWLLRAQRAAVHVHLGLGSFVEYVERLFGYQPRSTQEKLRVAEALESLPASRAALESGQLSWSALRELTRVAVVETEGEWLELAAGKTLRQLEQLVSGKRPGDSPCAAPSSAAERRVLRFDVLAETYALVREALVELRRRSGMSLDDDAALLEMARCVLGSPVLGGPRDAGRSSYQIALRVCPECRSGHLRSNGELVRVAPEIVELAQCDAQRVPTLPDDAEVSPSAPSSGERGCLESTAPSGPGRAHAHVSAPNTSAPRPASTRGHRHAPVGERAVQDIPPALRRAVLERDQHRCRVPGCRNATFVDVHHIEYRSDGGRHEANNLVTVCSAHHHALHRGKLRSQGDAASFRVLHADGRPYGHGPAPVQAGSAPVQAGVAVQAGGLETHAKVSSGLRQLGFREAEVRAAMAELRQRQELATATPEQWLRAALQRLTPSRAV